MTDSTPSAPRPRSSGASIYIDVKPHRHLLPRGLKCGHPNAQKKPCGNPAGFRTEHPGIGCCYRHGGRSENHNKAAARTLGKLLGTPRNIGPQEALLEEVRRAAGVVRWWEEQLDELTTRMADPSQETDPIDLGSERFETLSKIYRDERGHLAAVSAAALRVGIERRQVELNERYGAMIAMAITSVLAELGLPAEILERAPQLVRQNLLKIEAGTFRPISTVDAKPGSYATQERTSSERFGPSSTPPPK